MLRIESAGLTDIGKKRKGNEDAYLLDDDLQLYVVADGMGGRQAGEIASRIVIDTIRRTMAKIHDADGLSQVVGFDHGFSVGANCLVYSILRANLRTFETARHDPACKGMGSTVAALYFSDERAVISNVGDSPIFRVRGGQIETVSVSHTVMAEQAALAPEGGLKIGQHYLHMITRAMGIADIVSPDTRELDCRDGDVLVICSDGLSDKAFPEEIGDLATAHPPREACRRLVAMANERGGDDNITVVVVKIAGRQPTAETPRTAPRVPSVDSGPRLLVEYDTDEASYSTYVHNLRVDGIFLETSEPFAEGEELLLNLTDRASETTVMVSGIVMGRMPNGIDIRFQNLTAHQLETLKALVARL
jgi:serine/threonine protein phosphatase PrpC